MRHKIIILVSAVATLTGCNQIEEKTKTNDFYVPETVSSEAQEVIRSFKIRQRHPWPAATDLESWQAYWEDNEGKWAAYNDSIAAIYNPTIIDTVIGGVPVLDIRPQGWHDNHKVLVYTHGGAYVLFSARSMLMGSVPVAHRLNMRIISIDYTNPPRARSTEILDQIISVVQSLVKSGFTLSDIGMYGDSAGGALTAGSVLKMRDMGIGMPGAVVLISPWADITSTGDSYETLKNADPILNYPMALSKAALAYADKKDHKNPYISPVYADYSKGFPPTLIQGGTKEIFLSTFVRLYQAMDQSGVSVKLDLYEGMWHVFQEINSELPESRLAHKKMENFFRKNLEY